VLLEKLAGNKKKGFNRTNPTAAPAPPAMQDDKPSKTTPAPPTPTQHSGPTTKASAGVQERNFSDNNRRIRYCHYFSNGSCNFEQKTGKKCNFEHKKAPTCKYDGTCSREKCMFSHPTQNVSQGIFLEKKHFPRRRPIQIQDFVEQLMEQFQQTSQRSKGWNQGGRGRKY
jgi:hypothetical protein